MTNDEIVTVRGSVLERVEVYVDTSVVNGYFSRDSYIAKVSKLFFEWVRRGRVFAHTSTYAVAEIIRTPDGAKRDGLLSIAALCRVDAPSGGDVEELGREYVRRGG